MATHQEIAVPDRRLEHCGGWLRQQGLGMADLVGRVDIGDQVAAGKHLAGELADLVATLGQ